jgi:hypothetical protein
MPELLSVLTTALRPWPAPLMVTITLLTPSSRIFGQDGFARELGGVGGALLAPLKAARVPGLAHPKTCPSKSVNVRIVLLNVECTWSRARSTLRATLSPHLRLPALAGRGPFQVRALLRVFWPRTGSPTVCRTPR